ncbi:MAG: hypothetical protein K9J17_12860 [Flavobacteriales bacterium]|nr:hypothetical protein [Flavobacteriales bacterium]
MGIIDFFRNGFYLIIAIGVAAFGFQFGLYGLIVNTLGNGLHVLSIEELYTKGAGTKRQIELTDGIIWDTGLANYDDDGNLETFLYVVTLQDTTSSKHAVVIVESENKMLMDSDEVIIGLLKPFWTTVNENLKLMLSDREFDFDEQLFVLELNKEPWEWYWNLLVLLVSSLFIYRLIEAIFLELKSRKEKFLIKRQQNDNRPTYSDSNSNL